MGFLSSLFGLGGSSGRPSMQTVVQAQKLPEEIAPFVGEIAKEARDLYAARLGEGYVPFTGETIAPLTPQEETAMANIEGLVGTSRPLQEEALGITRGLAEKFTPETAEAYMSPYQRAVTDIEKREAERRFEREVRPRFEASAIQAGGLSGLGSRAGVESAELQRGQSQLIADIEAKGLQRAYQDAQQQFAQQKQREAGMAAEIGRAGPAMLASGLQEAGALQTVGEERRGLGQSALDEAYYRFLEEQQFPEQTLAGYSGFIYGNPLTRMPTTTEQTTGTPYQPSLGQTLLGVGSTLGAAALRNPNIFAFGGGGQKKETSGGGYIGREGGGYIDRDRGLSGLPMFRRQAGGPPVDIWEGVEDVEIETPQETIDEQVQVDSISGMDVQPEAERIIKLLGQGKITLPGEETREAGEKRLAAEKQSRVDLFNEFFPQEAEYSFAADALEGFGAMIVSGGNKAEKFNDVFKAAREKGANIRQANKLANYKIGLESLGKEEDFKKYIKDRPKRIRDQIVSARKAKLQEKYLKAKTKSLDPRRKDIEKLPLGLGGKEGEGLIATVSAILKAQDPSKYEAKYPGAGDVIEDLTERSERLVANRAMEIMKDKEISLNNATVIAFDELYRAGQLEEDQLLGFLW